MERSTLLNGKPQVVTTGVVASDGAVIFPDDLVQNLNYNADGTLNYVQIVVPATPGTDYAGGTYRQTLSYTAGALTGVTQWVKQ